MSDKQLDHLIIVGVDPFDTSSPSGVAAQRHVMDAANVAAEKIFFYDEDDEVKGVIAKTFRKDPSKRKTRGLDIGNSVCLVSKRVSKVKSYQYKLLRELTVDVRLGLDSVNLEEMTESNISEWMEKGTYTQTEQDKQKVERDKDRARGNTEDSDDLLDLLGVDPDDDSEGEPQILEEEIPSLEVSEETEHHDEVSSDFEDDADFDDFDNDLLSLDDINDDFEKDEDVEDTSDSAQPSSPLDTPDREDNLDTYTEETPKEPTSFLDELDLSPAPNIQKDLEGLPDEQESGDFDFLDDMDDLDTQHPTKEEDPGDEEEDISKYFAPVAEEDQVSQMIEDPVEEVEEDDNLFDDLGISQDELDDLLGDEEEESNDDIVESFSSGLPSNKEFVDDAAPSKKSETPLDRTPELTEKQKKQFKDADPKRDMELVEQEELERKRAMLMKKKRELKERKKLAEKAKSDVNAEKERKRQLLEAKKKALLASKAEQLENTRNEDGSQKTYRDYLSRDDNRIQDVQEESLREFGEIHAGRSDDSRYVGKDSGRIILVTSGKGGVGKSLVASGLAESLSLARNKYKSDHPQALVDGVWLIESDYNSPQLHITYGIDPEKNLGNIARVVAESRHGVNNDDIRRAIEENVHIDEATGIHILACPPLSERQSSENIPYAIILAIKYASERGNDVIIDHGNLTDGVYSKLDEQLSIKIAHRVVIVSNMNCLVETSDVVAILTQGRGRERRPVRNPNSIGIVLNSARSDQRENAQYKLRPIKIIGIIQPIDHLKPENSIDGVSNIRTVPRDVRKAIIDRCGAMLGELGYTEIARYFNGKTSIPKFDNRKKGFIRTIADVLGRNK